MKLGPIPSSPVKNLPKKQHRHVDAIFEHSTVCTVHHLSLHEVLRRQYVNLAARVPSVDKHI